MTLLDSLIPAPRLLETDHVDVAARGAQVWELVRNADLALTPIIRGLFYLRSLPERLAGHPRAPSTLYLDDLVSTPEHPGFQILSNDPPHELTVGAIGKVWQPDITFVHVPDALRYASFAEPGFIKVAWSLRVESLESSARLSLELRVDATDATSWSKFQHYFRLIGPGSRFIRRSGLHAIATRLGMLEGSKDQRPLAGDELVPDADAQLTHDITIEAPAEKIWPWLVQMGCHRAGFYSMDWLDNACVRSAREVHPEWQQLEVGQSIDNTPDGGGAFEVLRVDAPHVLILGGLFDADSMRPLAFSARRPKRFWHVTWAFALQPITATVTQLYVRGRIAFAPSEALHAAWIGPVHRMMESAQLQHLRARVDGTLQRDTASDVFEGLEGIARMCLGLSTPFLRNARSHWGLDAATAARTLPADELVSEPRWSWTHAVEIAAAADTVWPWVAQIGATHGGFYSYQWLENLLGCDLQNAETVHPEWQAKLGDAFSIHPKAPTLRIAALEPGRWFVAFSAPDEAARSARRPWVAASWLFFVEPLGDRRCRFVSRYRVAYSDDLPTRLAFGQTLLEPIGFAMDRRMLLGVKARCENMAVSA
jgi:hypothetical protein